MPIEMTLILTEGFGIALSSAFSLFLSKAFGVRPSFQVSALTFLMWNVLVMFIVLFIVSKPLS